MNVVIAGYQAVSILHGGPSTQIRNTITHLGQYGVHATRFDPWTQFTRQNCDIVHLFGANIGTYHLAREMYALHVPLVVTPIVYSLHSPPFIRASISTTRILQKLGKGIWTDYGLTADICAWARKVSPNTEAEKKLLARGFGVEMEKLTLIPNGVDDRFYRADPSLFVQKYGVKNFILNVGHTGHVRKNVFRLIKALGQIRHPAVIIGRIIRGEYGDACVREAAKHRHILLIDGMENTSELLASAYAACDTFVLPSLFETPGIAALEAGLAGAKVVITQFGGTREYFGAGAEYVDPRSVDSIRDGILTVLDRKKDETLREHIRKEFLWSRVAERTAAVYREALAGDQP